MKTNVVLMLLVVILAAFTACQKEELVPVLSKSEQMAIARENLPDDSEFFALMEGKIFDTFQTIKTKSADAEKEIKPTIGFMKPLNDLYLNSDGGYRQIWPWVMLENYENYAKDKGMIIIDYDKEYRIIDLQVYLGWDNNEYCNPVTITTNARNTQMGLTFNFPVVGGGNLSMTTFSNCDYDFEIWLPIMKYDLAWQTYTGARFGGVMSFDSSNQTEINILVGQQLDSNISDYLRIELVGMTSNSVVKLWVYDEDGNRTERSILLPKGKMVPPYVIIPLTFKPNSIYFEFISYKSGMEELLEFGYYNCYLIPTPETGVARYWGLK